MRLLRTSIIGLSLVLPSVLGGCTADDSETSGEVENASTYGESPKSVRDRLVGHEITPRNAIELKEVIPGVWVTTSYFNVSRPLGTKKFVAVYCDMKADPATDATDAAPPLRVFWPGSTYRIAEVLTDDDSDSGFHLFSLRFTNTGGTAGTAGTKANFIGDCMLKENRIEALFSGERAFDLR